MILEENTQLIQEQKDFKSFDDILKEKIGFGKFQIQTMFIITFIDFIDGAELNFLSISLQILKIEWNLESRQVEILSSSYYIGLVIGCIFSGYFCDFFGRKCSMQIGNLLQLFTIIWTVFVQDFYSFACIRILLGFSIGLTLIISGILSSEISSKHLRGRKIAILGGCIGLGKIYLLFISSFFLDDLSKGNWRAIVICQAVLLLILNILNFLILEESARLLVSQNKLEEAVKILNKMGKMNKKEEYIPINEQERNQLQNWRDYKFKQKINFKQQFKEIFLQEKYKNVTWRLLFGFTTQNFIYSSLMIILPFVLHQGGFGVFDLLIIDISEIPASIFCFFIIDLKSIGRVKIINSMLVLLIILSVSVYFFWMNFIIVGSFFINFCMKTYNICLCTILYESYGTQHRALGSSINVAFGRFAGVFGPFIIYKIFLYAQQLTYITFSLVFFITFLIFLYFPIEKSNVNLDSSESSVL
ncbi:major facilitator superfamily protein, putative [Ichthyophthirius multifiliis]|uniref:Major facilitator superfamily protein, putative n=1 Tax=Ichthyophthirius multifiliis TaxID=5932 RepID=G0QJE8_ICHMU|nr:major facilitator superfamily protein, putative [Ichthyophthirius multifiliis]EGR34660.1 major facilitator superfamily protein, putative [Ichthyophthirius multifiliis]|eukprot:XP_004039964.1 major facilitator superfamily protein, putative [Ichthyophthirius multifiliis]